MNMSTPFLSPEPDLDPDLVAAWRALMRNRQRLAQSYETLAQAQLRLEYVRRMPRLQSQSAPSTAHRADAEHPD